MFLTLAILDDVFEIESSDLTTFLAKIHKGRGKSSSSGNIQIKIKKDKESTPIMRRTMHGKREIDPNLAYGGGSSLKDIQRIYEILGFPDRFTWYNMRRGVHNEIDGMWTKTTA
jgi:hypothetical protein